MSTVRENRASKSEKLVSVKGMNDILPPDSARWEWLEEKVRELMAQYAYRNLRTPIVEPTNLFLRSLGEVTDIEQAVLDERRRELFSEWGHRWLDLKRFGVIDEVLGQKKPTWQPHAKLLPIPEQDILRNPFLTQNPGY